MTGQTTNTTNGNRQPSRTPPSSPSTPRRGGVSPASSPVWGARTTPRRSPMKVSINVPPSPRGKGPSPATTRKDANTQPFVWVLRRPRPAPITIAQHDATVVEAADESCASSTSSSVDDVFGATLAYDSATTAPPQTAIIMRDPPHWPHTTCPRPATARPPHASLPQHQPQSPARLILPGVEAAPTCHTPTPFLEDSHDTARASVLSPHAQARLGERVEVMSSARPTTLLHNPNHCKGGGEFGELSSGCGCSILSSHGGSPTTLPHNRYPDASSLGETTGGGEAEAHVHRLLVPVGERPMTHPLVHAGRSSSFLAAEHNEGAAEVNHMSARLGGFEHPLICSGMEHLCTSSNPSTVGSGDAHELETRMTDYSDTLSVVNPPHQARSRAHNHAHNHHLQLDHINSNNEVPSPRSNPFISSSMIPSFMSVSQLDAALNRQAHRPSHSLMEVSNDSMDMFVDVSGVVSYFRPSSERSPQWKDLEKDKAAWLLPHFADSGSHHQPHHHQQQQHTNSSHLVAHDAGSMRSSAIASRDIPSPLSMQSTILDGAPWDIDAAVGPQHAEHRSLGGATRTTTTTTTTNTVSSGVSLQSHHMRRPVGALSSAQSLRSSLQIINSRGSPNTSGSWH